MTENVRHMDVDDEMFSLAAAYPELGPGLSGLSVSERTLIRHERNIADLQQRVSRLERPPDPVNRADMIPRELASQALVRLISDVTGFPVLMGVVLPLLGAFGWWVCVQNAMSAWGAAVFGVCMLLLCVVINALAWFAFTEVKTKHRQRQLPNH